MEKHIISSIVVAILFVLVKILEAKFFDDQKHDFNMIELIKVLIRDGLIVFSCSFISLMAMEQLLPSLSFLVKGIQSGEIIDNSTKVFTGNPTF